MKIIGVNGFKRSGKGETANAIEAALTTIDETTTQVGFADKLKIIAAKALGFERSDEECIALMDEAKETWQLGAKAPSPTLMGKDTGWGEVIHSLTGREYLQFFGNEARGVFGDTFWIDQVLPNPEHFGGWDWPNFVAAEVADWYGTDYLVITDLRYPNEAQRVLDLGGEVWEVIRPGVTSDGHASETELPRNLVTRQISNDGSLDDLRHEVEAVLFA